MLANTCQYVMVDTSKLLHHFACIVLQASLPHSISAYICSQTMQYSAWGNDSSILSRSSLLAAHASIIIINAIFDCDKIATVAMTRSISRLTRVG